MLNDFDLLMARTDDEQIARIAERMAKLDISVMVNPTELEEEYVQH